MRVFGLPHCIDVSLSAVPLVCLYCCLAMVPGYVEGIAML